MEIHASALRLPLRGFLLQVRRVDGRDRDAAGSGERQRRRGLVHFSSGLKSHPVEGLIDERQGTSF